MTEAATTPDSGRPAEKVSEVLRRKSRSMLVLVVVIALLGPTLLLVQFYFSQRTSSIYTPVVDTTSRLVIAMRWAQSDLRMDRAYGLPGAEDRLRVLETDSREALTELQRLVGDDDAFSPALGKLTSASESWWRYAEAVVGTTPELAAGESPLSQQENIDAVMDFTAMVTAADTLLSAAMDKRAEMRTWRTVTLWSGSALTFVIIFLASTAIIRDTRRTARTIVDPIEELAEVARNDTEGGRGTRARTDEGPTEVRALAAAFNVLLDARDDYEAGREEHVRRLEELDRQKDDFVSTVSHELRTPLASIIGYTEMLCDGDGGDLTPAQHRLVSVVQRNADRLKGLIEDLLTLSRIEARGLDIDHDRLHLDAVVGHVLESLRPVAARADLTLAERIDPAEVTGDSLQLERAVTNLVSNAIKFTPEGGSVTVTLTADDDAATVTVSDTGIGIPEAEHEHLGTRFFRSSTAQRGSIPGTGLGLSIVQAIAEGHDGGLDFDSAEGEGTTFRLTVPLHHVRPPGASAPGNSAPKDTVPGGRGPTTA